MLRQFSHPQARQRLDRAAVFLSGGSPMESTLVVAPTRRAADEFVRQTAAQHGALFGVERSTATRLAKRLVAEELAREGLIVLTGFARHALVKRVLADLTWAYFGPVIDTPGFVEAAVKTLDRLAEANVTDESLLALNERGHDLAQLRSAYQRALEDHAAIDMVGVFRRAKETAKIPGRLVLIDPADRRSAEREFLRAIVASSSDALVVQPPTARDWPDAAKDETPIADFASCIAQAQAELFDASTKTRSADNSVTLFAASGEAAECADVARRVLEEAAAGTPFDRQAIFVRHAKRYLPLLLDAFGRAEIPTFTTQALPRPDPAGRALLSLIDCALDGVSATGFAEYLSFAQVPERTSGGAPVARVTPWRPAQDSAQLVFFSLEPDAAPDSEPEPVHLEAPEHWERLLVDAAVRGGVQRWRRRLKGALAELKRRAADEDISEARALALAEDARRLESLSHFALPLVEQLSALPDEAKWGQWLGWLADIAGLALAQPAGVIARLEQLRPLAELGPVSLAQVRHVVGPWLAEQREPSAHDRYGAVFVADVDEAPGWSFDVVHLMGLAEGSFPATLYGDPLLPDFVGEHLEPKVQARRQQRHDERGRLRQVVQAAERRLIASYPRVDLVNGRARVPSFYALELLRAAEGQAPEPEAMQRNAQRHLGGVFGWPLPPSRAGAIDAIEWDLKTLTPLLGSDPDLALGRGRYLCVNEDGGEDGSVWLRGLRQAALRGRKEWSRVDGLLSDDPEVRAHLAASSVSQKPHSATALQHFSACPYKFYLQASLRLRPIEEEEVVEHLDPRTYGTLFHEAQEVAFRRLTEADLIPANPEEPEEDRVAYRELIDAMVVDLEAAWREELAPAIEDVWVREIESMRRDLQKWAQTLVDTSAWQPVHAELAFGLPKAAGRDSASTEDAVVLFEKYPVRGAIDWIEQEVGRDGLRVIDHKTGRYRPPLEVVGGGQHLQPLLYAAAAAQLLKAPVDEGQLYYCTTGGGFHRTKVPATEANLEKLQEVLQTIDEAVTTARLPAAPDRNACRFCDYRGVCGSGRRQRSLHKDVDVVLEKVERLRNLK